LSSFFRKHALSFSAIFVRTISKPLDLRIFRQHPAFLNPSNSTGLKMRVKVFALFSVNQRVRISSNPVNPVDFTLRSLSEVGPVKKRPFPLFNIIPHKTDSVNPQKPKSQSPIKNYELKINNCVYITVNTRYNTQN